MDTMNTDTPETDGEWNRLACQDHPEFERNLADFARKMERERDEARGQLSAAKREAEYLATSIHRSEYSNVAPNWGLCDSVAGVISQIDNMYAGVRAQRDEAREKLKAQRAETAAQCAEQCAEAFLKTLNLWKP